MQKVITLFQRNYYRLVRDEVVPGAEWVIAGEGIATRKWDGTCCRFQDSIFYKRYELKTGRTPPPGFEAAQEPDAKTGNQPGWLPVGDGPEDKWFREAFKNTRAIILSRTYEAIGPHFGGGHHSKNPEACTVDILVPHGGAVLPDFPRDFAGIKHYFETMGYDDVNPAIEGVVWHHPDGRMVKIKARDFGIVRRMYATPQVTVPEL